MEKHTRGGKRATLIHLLSSEKGLHRWPKRDPPPPPPHGEKFVFKASEGKGVSTWGG